MKLLIVLAVVSFAAGAKIKCMVGDKETECADGITKCSGPLFKEYTGVADAKVKAACDKCAGETKGKTCSECVGEAGKAACNKAVEVGVDFSCYTYTYNATAKAFAAAANATACKRLKATAISCNMPKVNATAKTYTSTSGCGNCTKTDTHCEQCTKDKCNKSSAIKVAVLFAPLLAVLVNLL
jgi:hypothetical protein